ncbi:MAG: hypothetical protein OSJ83_02995 [Clostridia bacterium]|nr:hypothetical protein [Clostridia bacterium]
MTERNTDGDNAESNGAEERVEHIIDGVAFTVTRHFSGDGDLNDILSEAAYSHATGEADG